MLDPNKRPPSIHPETILGQVLEGHSPETQANLQRLALDFNLDANDPVFLAALLSGLHAKELNEILSTYPEEFANYSHNLNLWSQTINQLTITLKAETKDLASLATSSKKLITILTRFLDLSSNFTNKLETNNQVLTSLITEQQSCIEDLKLSLQQSESKQQQQISALQQILGKSQVTNNRWMSAINRLLQFGTGLGVSLLVWFTFTDAQTLTTQVDWSLTKLRRIECGLELREPGTPECQSFK